MADRVELQLALEGLRERNPDWFRAQAEREQREAEKQDRPAQLAPRLVTRADVDRYDGLCAYFASHFIRHFGTSPGVEFDDLFQECRQKVFSLLREGKRVQSIALVNHLFSYLRRILPPSEEELAKQIGLAPPSDDACRKCRSKGGLHHRDCPVGWADQCGPLTVYFVDPATLRDA